MKKNNLFEIYADFPLKKLHSSNNNRPPSSIKCLKIQSWTTQFSLKNRQLLPIAIGRVLPIVHDRSIILGSFVPFYTDIG